MIDPEVVVLGAINVDLVVAVEHRPRPGETVFGASFARRSGGKGANQAVAAARSGARVVLIGAVGDDREGEEEIAGLQAYGVDTSRVTVSAGASTGRAIIDTTPDGENSIVVVRGATGLLGSAEIDALVPRLQRTTVVVAQTDAPAVAVDRLAGGAIEHRSRLVVNNGPVVVLSTATLEAADPLIVNEPEGWAIAAQDCGSAEMLARVVRETSGCRSLVLTLGARGAMIADDDGVRALPARRVSPVDTTGAGDALVGTVAAALARGSGLDGAVIEGMRAGELSVRYVGARPPIGR